MPRGGRRVGAGRKPKNRPTNVVDARDAFASASPDAAPAAPEAPGRPIETLDPPKGMPKPQAAVWRMYAPLAVERRTLIASTAPAFALLCELESRKKSAAAKAARGGVSETRLYLQLARQVEALMARFGLAPFGKPVQTAGAAAAPPTTQDEDASFFGAPRRG